MPATTELAIELENRPGTLGKVCRTLADRGVNILAFELTPAQRTNVVYMVVDDPAAAKTILNKDRIAYTEGDVVQVKLPHRSGELARALSRLSEANINVNYAYCGAEPQTSELLVIFGVTEVGRAAAILDQVAAAAVAGA